MDLLSFKVLHIFGLFLVFTGLGGLIVQTLLGGGDDTKVRKLTGIAHGVGLLIVLVSGFGAIAKLQAGFPLWVLLKIVVWLLFGGIIVVIRRKPDLAALLWWILPLLGAFAGYLAIFKPF